MKTSNLMYLRFVWLFYALTMLAALFIWACKGVEPTRSDNLQTSSNSFKKKAGGNVLTKVTDGQINASVWVFVGLFDPFSDSDNATVSTPSSATNIRFRVTRSGAPTSCDPVGSSSGFVQIDGDPNKTYSSCTGWITTLPNGSHSFYLYAYAQHSTAIDACTECQPPPGECTTDSQTSLTVEWQ